ncbi:hypothetical protein ALC60_14009 [Trachymyrmex zeteki]|uniref:Uncharacterized protein n=1 Tax=Mycetomoellerius zeteki TaxID=64791 RepID=A0A151WGL5_9HYME|nr:hypothetical protein ALC60_14009 [Trachymyrmex zeteki]
MLYDFQFTKYNGWFNASVLTGGLRSEKERRSCEYGSEASNWRMEIIQELKTDCLGREDVLWPLRQL